VGMSLVGPLPTGQMATQISTPSFVSANLVGDAGTFVNFGGYSVYRAPDGAGLSRNGHVEGIGCLQMAFCTENHDVSIY